MPITGAKVVTGSEYASAALLKSRDIQEEPKAQSSSSSNQSSCFVFGKEPKPQSGIGSVEGKFIHAPRFENGVKLPDVTSIVKIYDSRNNLIVAATPDTYGDIKVELTAAKADAQKGFFGSSKTKQTSEEITIEISHDYKPYKKAEENNIKNVVVETIKKTYEYATDLNLGEIRLKYAYQPQDPALMNLPAKDQLFQPSELIQFLKDNSPVFFNLLSSVAHVKIHEAANKLYKYLNKHTPLTIANTILNALKLSKPTFNSLDVQEYFDANSQKKYPEIPHTAENFIQLLTTTVLCTNRRIENDKVIWELNWKDFELDIDNSVANTQVIARKNPNGGYPILEAVKMDFLTKEGVVSRTSTWDAEDTESFANISHAVRSQFAYWGEIRDHLSIGHLDLEYAVEAINRNLRSNNPFMIATKQNLQGTEQINKLGAGFGGTVSPPDGVTTEEEAAEEQKANERTGVVFGKDSILEKGALIPVSLKTAMQRCIDANASWKIPPLLEPIADEEYDYFAHSMQQYYAKQLEIQKVFVENNWEYFNTLDAREQFRNLSLDMHENNPNIPNVYEMGISDDEYKNNLALYRAYIYLLIFKHSLWHGTQYVLGNVKNCSLAIQDCGVKKDENGEVVEDESGNEVLAEDGNTDPLTTLQTKLIIGVLTGVKMPTMLDEEYDVDPEVRRINEEIITTGALRFMKEKDFNNTDPREMLLKSVPI